MLILIAHGSAQPEWRDSVEGLLRSVQDVAGEDAVQLAYMDHGPPSLMDTLSEAIRSGTTAFRILPLFLTGEGHVTGDIRPMVEEVRVRYGHIDVELLPAVGQHPLFGELLLEIISQSAV